MNMWKLPHTISHWQFNNTEIRGHKDYWNVIQPDVEEGIKWTYFGSQAHEPPGLSHQAARI